MANPTTAPADPSMEEILQSIRRIITEDDAAPAKPAAAEVLAPKVVEDVLELTEVVEEPKKAAPPSAPEAKKPAPRADVMEEIEQMTGSESKGRKVDDDMLVSARVAQEATDAIANLMESIPRAKEPAPRAPVDPSMGLTVEEWLGKLLRPLLKNWLDENLPGIVRETVEKEIRKIVR